ncbi:MAG: FAD:protein FMN transferase, partial [Candidatus Caldatribacteriaceae bacterium]
MSILPGRAFLSPVGKKVLWSFLFFLVFPLGYFFQGMRLERYTFFGLDTIIEVSIPRRYAFLKEDMERSITYFDRLWNRFSKESVVWRINHFPSVEVDLDTLTLVKEALDLSKATGGFFCPLIASLIDLWDFSGDPKVPKEEELQRVVKEIAQSYLIVRNRQVSIRGKAQLDLGGIAKGYVVDFLVSFLKSKGVKKALINAGGQVYGFGARFRVGILNPVTGGVAGYIVVDGVSVSTSGDYFRFFEEGGVRYHHVLNPMTGYPGKDFRSVT